MQRLSSRTGAIIFRADMTSDRLKFHKKEPRNHADAWFRGFVLFAERCKIVRDLSDALLQVIIGKALCNACRCQLLLGKILRIR